MLFYNLRKRGIYRPRAGWPRFLLQLRAANLVMGQVPWFGVGDLESWTQASARERLWHLAGLIAAGGASFVIAVLAVGIRPRHLVLRRS